MCWLHSAAGWAPSAARMAHPPGHAGKGSECGDAITTHNLIDKVAVSGWAGTSVGGGTGPHTTEPCSLVAEQCMHSSRRVRCMQVEGHSCANCLLQRSTVLTSHSSCSLLAVHRFN